MRVVEPFMRLKFSLNDFTASRSLTRFTNLCLFWLSNLSKAKINLPTYHISSMISVLPPCVNSFVMSMIIKITSWLLSTSKSRILENFSVVMHKMNCLHYKNLRWIDKISSKCDWFWIERYIVSFKSIRSYLLRSWRFYMGLLR